MKQYLVVPFLFTPLLVTAQMPPPPPNGGPPAEAFNACRGVQLNANCQFSAPHGRVSGRCLQMREPQPVCVPDRGGPPNNGRQNRAGAMPEFPPHRQPSVAISANNDKAQIVASLVPDTGQGSCFDNQSLIDCPNPGHPFYGQDAQFLGKQASYQDNGDGTVTDNVTGLTWQQAHNSRRLGWYKAKQQCETLQLGGYSDWRLPTIKELFSIADFSGATGRKPFLNSIFDIEKPGTETLQGDPFASSHHTEMMGQTWASTLYTGEHWNRPGVEAAFFFNFLDGRIKQAPTTGRPELFYRCVRGKEWGTNRFVAAHQGTVTDTATKLMWQQQDDGKTRHWQQALEYCNTLTVAGFDDWRLPNIKELQSIVDYRVHDPALDQGFFLQQDKQGWFWSSTTHGDNIAHAAYICFGKCISVDGIDVHGAGAQRSDPKTGDPARYSRGMGGQKDQVRINNYARCVRSVD